MDFSPKIRVIQQDRNIINSSIYGIISTVCIYEGIYRYDILSKPKASSKQPESSELERKIENYGKIGILKAEYQVTRF